MLTSRKKQYLMWAALIAASLSLSFFTRTQAQVAAGQTPTPDGRSCILGQTAGEYSYLLVPSDGAIKAVAGTYNVNLKCTAGDPNCDMIAAAMSTAENDGNSLGSDFPQYTTGSSNNSFEIGFGGDSTTCGNHSDNGLPAGACESTAVVSSNGVTSTIAYIYINVSSSDYAVSSKNPSQFASILEHEMTHGFGYDDTYVHIKTDPGLMGEGINSIPPATWKTDSLLLGLILLSCAWPASSCVSRTGEAGRGWF